VVIPSSSDQFNTVVIGGKRDVAATGGSGESIEVLHWKKGCGSLHWAAEVQSFSFETDGGVDRGKGAVSKSRATGTKPRLAQTHHTGCPRRLIAKLLGFHRFFALANFQSKTNA
jgi:hypothetical protein